MKNLFTQLKYKTGSTNDKHIIFILHSNNHKSGGDKVIYRQSELINNLSLNGIKSEILHPENVSFQHTWFEHNASFKRNLKLDPKNDFVVIPEIWALPHAKLLSDIGVKYAIYVQNGYLTNIPVSIGYSIEELNIAYKNASLILSISDDTTECIKLAFPELKTEIIRIHYSVDIEKFKIDSKKENLITYMPRKLSFHSKMIIFFLKNRLPQHWRINAIDGLNEDGVRDILSRSKIFMSFSEFEGCPLPPVEAGLSGNHVVGYTGEGAKEYWNLPIFTEVYCGDIRDYVEKVLRKINELENNPPVDFESIDTLAKRYSADAEIRTVSKFVDKVNSVLD